MNGSLLRLLDANANRAREALRMLEDYARFVLDAAELSMALKELRHELIQAIGSRLPEAILHRDTAGDVGTANKTESEQSRADLEQVIVAGGKRLGEALRSIEEFLKTDSAADAARVESLRYRFYDLERTLALTFGRGKRFADVRLYVLITQSLCRQPWLQAGEQAILGGADCLQLREKELDGAELLRRAQEFVRLCHQHNVLAVINDRPDIALLCGADGIHVGQDDLPAIEVRKLLGPDKIVGVSTHRIEQARQAVLDGADYIGVGPFFRSSTKPRDFLAGPEYARQVTASIRIPAVAIAGITEANVDDVLDCGIEAVAVSSAVIGAADVRDAAKRLKKKLVGQTFLSASSKVVATEDLDTLSPVGQTFLSASSKTEIGKTSASQPELEISHRRLPHWRLEGSTYFVTFRLAQGVLEPPERTIVLNHIKYSAGTFYQLFAAVVMPDHVHILIKPNEGIELSRITKGIKGVSSRLLNALWKKTGSVWQEESWDRIMRDQSEFDEKLQYMLNNPVKAGLVQDGWSYDGWYYQPSGND